jgi:hypothetical protein
MPVPELKVINFNIKRIIIKIINNKLISIGFMLDRCMPNQMNGLSDLTDMQNGICEWLAHISY